MTKQSYPTYDALWPLVAMGVLDEGHRPNGWTYDAAPAKRTRVAMIDVSVAIEHPNLKPAINTDLALDLFSTRLGALSGKGPDDTVGALDLNTGTTVAEDLPHSTRILTELIDRLSPNSPAWQEGVRPMTAPEFSNHGTAIAGLIGARPTVVELAEGFPSPLGQQTTIPLPFAGVDPMCEIVPISTNFDTDPEVMIVAFLYAELIRADVILLPRSIPDPLRTVPELNTTHEGTPIAKKIALASIPEERLEKWEELAQLITNISLYRPIVCAAGNANEDTGIYPANLASDHNGIIAVGAVNAKGLLSSYSPADDLTIWGPSDDGERFDRDEVRLDERAHDYDPIGVPAQNANHRFSHYEVVSTDVPGGGGYSDGPYVGPEPDMGVRDFGSYFCRFGGTSASSALVAGFLSLGLSCGRLGAPADGMAAKSWLMSRAVTLDGTNPAITFPHWSGTPSFPDSAPAT